MGWMGGYRTKKEMVNYLNYFEHDSDRFYRTLKSKNVRERGVDILWQLNEVVALRDLSCGMKKGDRKRFILCVMLEKTYQGDWAYKSVSEECGPVFYSCPKEWLNEVPVPNDEYAKAWREKVLACRGGAKR